MSISNYGELAFLNTLRNTSFAVANPYVKLHLGDPGEDGTANPAAETTRKAITFSAASAVLWLRLQLLPGLTFQILRLIPIGRCGMRQLRVTLFGRVLSRLQLL